MMGLVAALVSAVTACEEPRNCFGPQLAGLDVDVYYQVELECDGTVTAVDGTYSENLLAIGCSWSGLVERPRHLFGHGCRGGPHGAGH